MISSSEPSAGAAASPSAATPQAAGKPPHKVYGKQAVEAVEAIGSADTADAGADDDIKSQTLSRNVMHLVGRLRRRIDEAIEDGSLDDMLKYSIAKEPVNHYIGKSFTLQELDDIREVVFATEEMSAFHGCQDDFDDACVVALELMSRGHSTAGNMTKHWKGRARQQLHKKKALEALIKNVCSRKCDKTRPSVQSI